MINPIAVDEPPASATRAALATLAHAEAAVLLLAAQPGMTYRDVARITGQPPRVVLQQIRAGLSSLRRQPHRHEPA